MANNITPKLKAFVRIDGTGRVIPGGPIFQASKPKVGNWKEVPLYYRGGPTTTTTSTTVDPSLYNAGFISNGSTVVCNNQGQFNLPISESNACVTGYITLLSGTYPDYGIPNGSRIYINLKNGNVIDVETYNDATMSYGCTGCGGSTSTTTSTSTSTSSTTTTTTTTI